MNRTATIVFFASLFASACATPQADITNVNADLRDALVAGDLDLAFDIGYDFVGQPIDNGDEGGLTRHPRPDGFLTATYIPDARRISSAVVTGTFTAAQSQVSRDFGGERLLPVDEQVQGEIYGVAYKDAEVEDGQVQATFRASPTGTMGGVQGLWTDSSRQRPISFEAVYTDTAENEGQMFGVYRVLAAPVWTEALRVRIFADGLSILEITPDSIFIHHIMGVAPGQAGTADGKEARAAEINEESWLPTWPEEGENADCNCDSSVLMSGEAGFFSPEAAATVAVDRYLTRGYVTVIEQPTEENGFLTRVLLNDTNYTGGTWYQFDLSFKQ